MEGKGETVKQRHRCGGGNGRRLMMEGGRRVHKNGMAVQLEEMEKRGMRRL